MIIITHWDLTTGSNLLSTSLCTLGILQRQSNQSYFQCVCWNPGTFRAVSDARCLKQAAALEPLEAEQHPERATRVMHCCVHPVLALPVAGE